jgi:hypothetical protein
LLVECNQSVCRFNTAIEDSFLQYFQQECHFCTPYLTKIITEHLSGCQTVKQAHIKCTSKWCLSCTGKCCSRSSMYALLKSLKPFSGRWRMSSILFRILRRHRNTYLSTIGALELLRNSVGPHSMATRLEVFQVS